jgi:hypothetical protein
MSAPLKGSDMAKNWMGRIGSMLVKTPSKMITIGRTIHEGMTADPAALKLKGFPNSVDTLAPNNRFVMGINKVPAPCVPAGTGPRYDRAASMRHVLPQASAGGGLHAAIRATQFGLEHYPGSGGQVAGAGQIA